jgi:hypothetical protein
MHLRMMCADSAFELKISSFRPGMLILAHAISPLISVGVAIAGWIAASFWVFALVMGNPDGTERGDDGKAAVLAVRNWWEGRLLSAVR